MQRRTLALRQQLVARSLNAFIQAGTIELSLDQLAARVGASKRMLVHYFGDRETLEESAVTLLEETLRVRFSPDSFPAKAGPQSVIRALWERSTAPEARGVLLLVMDLSRRAWSGSERAKAFYAGQQRLWADLLMNYLADRDAVERVLQVFQGAVLAFLITGDPEPGRRTLEATFPKGPAEKTTKGPKKKARAGA